MSRGEFPELVRTTASKASGVSVQRVVIAVLAVVGAAGTFLPWLTIQGLGSVDGWGSGGEVRDGRVTLALFGIVFAVACIGRWSVDLLGPRRVACAALSLLAMATGVFDLLMIRTRILQPDQGEEASIRALREGSTICIGLYIVISAGLCCAILPFAIRSRRPA